MKEYRSKPVSALPETQGGVYIPDECPEVLLDDDQHRVEAMRVSLHVHGKEVTGTHPVRISGPNPPDERHYPSFEDLTMDHLCLAKLVDEAFGPEFEGRSEIDLLRSVEDFRRRLRRVSGMMDELASGFREHLRRAGHEIEPDEMMR